MSLVFIHGVNVRYDSGTDPFVQSRTALFRRFALPSSAADASRSLVLNPYWGNHAAKFPWNHAALSGSGVEVFGDSDTTIAVMTAESGEVTSPDAALLHVARRSLEAAVNGIWTAASGSLSEGEATELADAAFYVAAYIEANPQPEWLQSVADDEQFVSTLIEMARTWSRTSTDLTTGRTAQDLEEFGGASSIIERLQSALASIRAAVTHVGDEARRAGARARRPADALFSKARAPVHRTITTFLGDVFMYFHQREQHRRAIADIVIADVELAVADRERTGEAVVIVAHSMGGVIAYDLLTSLLTDVRIDVLATVGSQVAVIEELKLFTASDPSVPNDQQPKVPKPANVGRWINVFDTTDILGFAATGVFEGVQDHVFATGHAWAHGGYFVEPSFHRRLGVRLR